ncbi:glycoside hydrolase family 16 protein [Athelia psychrophila]|uniref:Glycoside hydrolase family 16 protein n=1 Tax=Athelia psychrophila TaxID=1759441 RepID=A0A166WGP2_9AGAM|nr:glycoside hydrolase family 16 protein [Fibularhizoctonia sp. CBS 109695]
MHRFWTILVPLLVSLATVTAQAACSADSLCPAATPCCSEFGFCGTGYYCLGGCNPLTSNSLTSCMPNPVCQNANHTFADNSRILPNVTMFNGNASAYDWTLDKGNIVNTNASGGELALILSQTNGGTRISSTRYLHYGTITARIKTGQWGGVVTAFITMSDIKDEIDWEFPGDATTEGQTNYFWEGVVPTADDGTTVKDLSNTYDNYHDYTIDWQADALTWKIDGKTVRTLKASDAQNGSISQYPNTPSRVQVSLWPGGISSEPAGTVAWAGGMIDWSEATNGQFEALVSSISIVCADPTAASANTTGYVYQKDTSTNTPGITFTSAATNLGESSNTSSGKAMKMAKEIGIIAGVGVFLLIVTALIIRSCMMANRKKARTTGHAANIAAGLSGGGGQSYRPVNANASRTNLGLETMPDRGYGGQNQSQYNQYNTPPSPQYERSPYGGGPQYSSQPQSHRY